MKQPPDSTFKPALMLMSGRALAFAVTFFVPAVLARVFTLEEFGTYKQFMLITYTLYAFGQFGLSECLFYFLPLKPAEAGRYVFNSLIVLGALGLFFSGLLLLNTSNVARWMNNDALAAYVPITALFIVFMLMGTVLEITMISRKSYRLATITYVVSDVLRAAFLVIPALVMGSLVWALIGAVTFSFVRVLAILTYFRAEFGADLRFSGAVLREQLAYALPFFSATVIHIVQGNYHQYAVSWHYDPATVAIYSVGCLQIPLVDFMATPAANVMMVQMGENLRDNRRGSLLAIWNDTARKLAFVFFPLVGLLIANAYPLITLLFGSAYAASVPIFMVFSLSILFSAFPTDGVLRTFADNRWRLILNLAQLVVIVALMGRFLAAFDLIGAVMVTLIGILIAKTIALVRMKRLFQAPLSQVLPWKSLSAIFAAALVSAGPAVILNAKLDIPALVLLPISGMAYMVTYSVIVLSFGLLNDAERAAMKRYVYVWNRRSIESR